MTDLELVKETVDYYTEEPTRRSLDSKNHCMYKTPDGKMCAVGRLLDEEKMKKLRIEYSDLNREGSIDGYLTGWLNFHSITINDLLKDEYKGVSRQCLIDIQDFHDYGLINLNPIRVGRKLIKKYESA